MLNVSTNFRLKIRILANLLQIKGNSRVNTLPLKLNVTSLILPASVKASRDSHSRINLIYPYTSMLFFDRCQCARSMISDWKSKSCLIAANEKDKIE